MRYLAIIDFGEPQLDEDVDAPVRLWRLTLIAALLGVLAGFIDLAITELIRLITNLAYYQAWSFAERTPDTGAAYGLWAALLPAAGGLLVGVLEKLGSPAIRGGGLGAAQAHALGAEARIPRKIALLKPLSAAVSIGTGSPLGREGPTIQSTDAISSLFAPWFRLSPAEQRLLIGCAAAAGMAATYRTALAGPLLAVEVILFKIRSRALVPLIVAAASAAVVDYLILGPGMLVQAPPIGNYGLPGTLPLYALFGAGCGLLGVGVYHALWAAKSLFRKLPARTMWAPALGGLAVGFIGLVVPNILGVGYQTDRMIFRGELGIPTLALIAPLKLAAFLLAFGSGLSGGMLSPNFMAGASLGSLFAHGMNALAPGLQLNPAAFALAGAGAVFGAASRAPLTMIVLTFELVGESQALIPFTVANVVAVAVAALLLKYPIQVQRILRR